MREDDRAVLGRRIGDNALVVGLNLSLPDVDPVPIVGVLVPAVAAVEVRETALRLESEPPPLLT